MRQQAYNIKNSIKLLKEMYNMTELDLINKYGNYIDTLDFKGLYDQARSDGNYGYLFDLMFIINEELKEENKSLFHQASKLGYKVFEDEDQLYDYLEQCRVGKSGNHASASTTLQKIHSKFKNEFRYVTYEGDEIDIYDLFEELDNENQKVEKIIVDIFPSVTFGFQKAINLVLDDDTNIYFYIELPNSDCAYGFVELGGCIHKSNVLKEVNKTLNQIKDII